MTVTAHGTKGITLEVTVATVDTAIAQVAAYVPPAGKVQHVRAQPLDADHDEPVYAGTILNETSTFQLYLDPLNDVHEFLMTICNDTGAAEAGALLTWTQTFTQISGIDPWIFTGMAETFAITGETNGILMADCTVQVAESTGLPIETP